MTLYSLKVRFISIFFSKINYGSYLHAVSLWVSSELYRVFVLVLFSYFSVFGSMLYIKLAGSAFHRLSIRIPYLNSMFPAHVKFSLSSLMSIQYLYHHH